MRSPEKDEVEQKPVHVGKAAVKLFFYAGLQVIHARYQRLDVEEEDAFPEFLPLKECIGSDCNADGLYVVEKSHFVCLLGINVPILPLVKVGFDGIGLRKIALRIELDEPINWAAHFREWILHSIFEDGGRVDKSEFRIGVDHRAVVEDEQLVEVRYEGNAYQFANQALEVYDTGYVGFLKCKVAEWGETEVKRGSEYDVAEQRENE